MNMNAGPRWSDRYAFNTAFATDWILGRKLGLARSGRRESWDRRMLEKMRDRPLGRTLKVERRRNLSPAEFRRDYFLTGKPVVLEAIATAWPAVEKWSFEYLRQHCGQDDIAVLDGHNWKAQADPASAAIDAADRAMTMAELLEGA